MNPLPTSLTADTPCAETPCAKQRWELRRNCALTPRAFLFALLGPCCAGLAIGIAFWLVGYRLVMLYAALELLAVAGAALVYCRHVRDGETLTLEGGRLQVDSHRGGETRRLEFPTNWLQVEGPSADNASIGLRLHSHRTDIGRHVTPLRRAATAHALRHALGRPADPATHLSA